MDNFLGAAALELSTNEKGLPPPSSESESSELVLLLLAMAPEVVAVAKPDAVVGLPVATSSVPLTSGDGVAVDE